MAAINDITLGQYIPGDSFIYQLDPRTKLIAAILFMTSLLVSLDPVVLMIFLVLSILIVKYSGLPVKLVFRNLRPFLWLFGLTLFIHMVWTTGQPVVELPGLVTVTREGIQLGLIYALRLGLLILFAAVLTLSTSPIELTDALDVMMSPLKRLKLPVHEIVLMLTLSLRFIPTLLQEAQRIRNAQISRGASFEGSLKKKVQSIIPIILPLFISAFRRADELALAMDARCYSGGEGRTCYQRLEFAGKDYAVLLISFLIMILSIVL